MTSGTARAAAFQQLAGSRRCTVPELDAVDADVDVECWFCAKTLSRRKTVELPNGARVCRKHRCQLCGEFVRPVEAVVLRTPAAAGGGAQITYLCGSHRRHIVERVQAAGAVIHAGDSKW